jgi:LysM repeat protein
VEDSTINNPTSLRKDANSAKSMNSPNPFVPQGSLLELQSKRRSRLKFTVYCVLAVGVTGLTAMLIQGCKREQTQVENQPPIETNETAMNANLPPPPETSNLPPPVEASNPPVPPPVVTAPPVAPVETQPAQPAETEYVVVKGDSFWKIAKKNGVSVKAIEAANPNVEPTRLKVGQKLIIPAPSSAAESAPATGMTGSSSTDNSSQIYVVKSGDTLSRIARHHGTTVKAIEAENNLLTTRIKVGQQLKIPAQAEAPAPTAAPVPAPVAAPPDTNTAPAPDGNTGTQ